MAFRTGIGYDVHRLIEGDHITLGGVRIPHNKTTLAHSDGDVLLHAICDALLGAAALGDIGKHFPDTNPEYKNISSLHLLQKTVALLEKEQYIIINVDSTLIAENPKVLPFVDEMITTIAETINIKKSQLSIKATTNEKIGFIGREEGIAAIAIVTIQKII